jgi:Zn-dependent protease with chaperone function
VVIDEPQGRRFGPGAPYNRLVWPASVCAMQTDMSPAHSVCPECATPLPVDERFTVWCPACGWNVDPIGEEPAGGRLEAFRRRQAARHGDRLFEEVATRGPGRPGRTWRRITAYALAAAVHAVTVALAIAGVYVIVTGLSSIYVVIGGLILLLFAYVLRPRLKRPERGADTVSRAEAPHLYALLDRIAASLDAAPVHTVVPTTEVNAAITLSGVRGRPILFLGIPFWDVLTPRQRVALLGHEIGHTVNGDSRHGVVIGSALRTLQQWYGVLRPDRPTLGEMPTTRAARVLMFVPTFAVLGLIKLLDRLTLTASIRAEYAADGSAAQVGSTRAAVELLDVLLLVEPIEAAMERRRVMAGTRRATTTTTATTQSTPASEPVDHAAVLWPATADFAASIPEHERERRRRLSHVRGHIVDATHPPTHLRRVALTRRPAFAAAVDTTEAEHESIRAELAPARMALAREFLAS